MQNIKKIAEMLQDNEITLLRALYKKDNISSLDNLSLIEFIRAGMWLENKNLVSQNKIRIKYIVLDELGKKYVSSELPEFKLLQLLRRKSLPMKDLERHFGKDESTFVLGYAKKKSWISIENGNLTLTKTGEKIKETLESRFLHKLNDKKIELNSLADEEKYAYAELRKRKKIVREVEETEILFKITALGKKVVNHIPRDSGIGVLSSSIIKSGSWENKRFRRYDVSAGVPRIYPGLKQRYLAYLDNIKQELISMGFQEMQGPIIESIFFNNDALFMPQDHPARGIHDLYTINGTADLSQYKRIITNVKHTHENGGISSSKGWNYSFSEDETKKLVLRSQTTAVSARTIASDNLKNPGKYFCIGRCYRPDVIDATHLTEFDQLEGIVVGKELNFRQLLGLLANFAMKFANVPMEKIKFLPGYFPFTEPSVETFVYSDELGKWIEILAAGMFRPEVTIPLGVREPVLAWGIGVPRLFMIKEKISDIRMLFSQDLDWLRGKN